MKDVAEAQVLVSWCRERKEMLHMDGHSNDTVCDAMCVRHCARLLEARKRRHGEGDGRRESRDRRDQYVRLTTECTNDVTLFFKGDESVNCESRGRKVIGRQTSNAKRSTRHAPPQPGSVLRYGMHVTPSFSHRTVAAFPCPERCEGRL